MKATLTHTLPLYRELEARVEVTVIKQLADASLVETLDGERLWMASFYLKPQPEVKK